MDEKTSVELLLVEDNPGDVRLTREALRGSPMVTRLSVVADGDDALDFMRHRHPHESAPRPDLILLDLNLPRLKGDRVLAEIKEDPDLRRIPVVVLTSSTSEADIRRAYELHANCYFAKPVQLEEFIELIGAIQTHWMRLATLPPN